MSNNNPAELSDEQLDELLQKRNAALTGFKGWGYRDIMRDAIEADRAIRNAPASPPVSPEPDMPAICAALGFDPTNHHNAAKCPYCSPGDRPASREGVMTGAQGEKP